jgi:polysaccharide pyruvyl transferase WcaK-like protein
LILHAYSAANLGDGLLVRETIEIIREAFEHEVEITIAASHPQTFASLNVHVLDSAPSLRGYRPDYLRTLWTINRFDLVVGVGGGYLRAGHPIELAKTVLVHGPQLLASSYRASRAVYLPQSVGPARFGTAKGVSRLLSKIDVVMLRDDRSMLEFARSKPRRMPDLATSTLKGPGADSVPSATPVLSIRSVRGSIPSEVLELAQQLGEFDAYVQSTSSGNDDRPATSVLHFRSLLHTDELMTPRSEPRVVVAVRLHAALMALHAGHYVVHLAYERKGFGAFDDLGLNDYVFNVNSFSASEVVSKVQELLSSDGARERYIAAIAGTESKRNTARSRIIEMVRGSGKVRH